MYSDIYVEVFAGSGSDLNGYFEGDGVYNSENGGHVLVFDTDDEFRSVSASEMPTILQIASDLRLHGSAIVPRPKIWLIDDELFRDMPKLEKEEALLKDDGTSDSTNLLEESEAPPQLLRHSPLGPRLEMIISDPVLSAYLTMDARTNSQNGIVVGDGSYESVDKTNLHTGELWDIPPLETDDGLVEVFLGLAAFLKCNPDCELCEVQIPAYRVPILDRQFSWLHHCFDLFVSILLPHLLLCNFIVTEAMYYKLFRIWFNLYYNEGVLYSTTKIVEIDSAI